MLVGVGVDVLGILVEVLVGLGWTVGVWNIVVDEGVAVISVTVLVGFSLKGVTGADWQLTSSNTNPANNTLRSIRMAMLPKMAHSPSAAKISANTFASPSLAAAP